MKIEKSKEMGFCLGVKRAVATLEKIARERGGIETLGAVVHNQEVLDRLADKGIRTVRSLDEVRGKTVVTSTHGVSPQVLEEIQAKGLEVISTTCPFVQRAQLAAERLAKSGFFVVVYGDANHPEVRGIVGWAAGKGIAVTDWQALPDPLPRRVGILSQTTQIPARFSDFVKKVIDIALTRDAEVHVIDTICHDIRERQAAALELAGRVDVMLVVGGRTSANTHHLYELCSTVTRTYIVETAKDIDPSWLKGAESVGVTAGASTADWTVDEVVGRVGALTMYR